METPHDDPLRQISETRGKTTSSRVAFHQGITEAIGEEDGSTNLELVSPDSHHAVHPWTHAAIRRNVVRTRSVASLSSGAWHWLTTNDTPDFVGFENPLFEAFREKISGSQNVDKSRNQKFLFDEANVRIV